MCGNGATGLERTFLRASGSYGPTLSDVLRGRVQAATDSGDREAAVSASVVVGYNYRSVTARSDGTAKHDGTSVLEMGVAVGDDGSEADNDDEVVAVDDDDDDDNYSASSVHGTACMTRMRPTGTGTGARTTGTATTSSFSDSIAPCTKL